MKTDPDKPFQPELYRSYLRVLVQVQLRGAGPRQQKISASDIVQEALTQALVALPQFKGTTTPEFAGWLRAILANKLADAVRHFGRKKRDAALEESFRQSLDASARNLEEMIPDDRTSPTQRVLRHERALRLTAALAVLPPEQRTAIELHHLAGYSMKEIAQQMNRTSVSVAGLVRRGLQTLREHLDGQRQEFL